MKRNGMGALGFESLENRRLLAGDVTIVDNSFGGTLEITGDGADNFIVVTQGNRSDELVLTGLSTANGPTTINGSTNPFFIDLVNYDGEIRSINADFGGGDDLYFFENATVLADINANMGDGDDDLELATTQVAGVVVGTNVEDVTIDTFYVIDDLALSGNQMVDVDIFDARIDGNLSVQSTAGNNALSENFRLTEVTVDDVLLTMDRGGRAWTTDSNVVGNYVVNTLRGGNHDINLERTDVSGVASFTTKGGADQIHLGSQTITGGLSINSGGGQDSVTLDTVTVDRGDLFVNTGGGNDTFYSENGLWQTTELRTGSGADSITIFDAILENDIDILSGGGNDNLLVSGINVSGTMTVRTGGGNDTMAATSGQVFGNYNINMGNGTDTLSAGQNTVTATSVWNGAGGTDTYDDLGANSGPITVRGFENFALKERETDEALVDLFADTAEFHLANL